MFSSGEQLRSHLKQTAGAGPQPGRGTAGADTSCGVCTTHQPGSRERLVDHIRTSHTVFKEVKFFLFYFNFFYLQIFFVFIQIFFVLHQIFCCLTSNIFCLTSNIFCLTSNIFLILLLLSGLQLQAETGDGDLVVFSRWEGNQI